MSDIPLHQTDARTTERTRVNRSRRTRRRAPIIRVWITARFGVVAQHRFREAILPATATRSNERAQHRKTARVLAPHVLAGVRARVRV